MAPWKADLGAATSKCVTNEDKCKNLPVFQVNQL